MLNTSSGTVLGHSDGLNQEFSADCYRLGVLLNCTEGTYQKGDDETTMYVVSRQYRDVLLCAALPRKILF